MTLDEYSSYDALGLAELVRRGEVSASELAELARRAIAATNPALNFLAGAIDEAGVGERDASAPFAGVPFLLKDLGAHVANVPIEYGSRIARGVKFEQDSELAARYRRSGVVFVGRTTTPEFGLSPTTESSLHGVTSNPWNTALSPGGSSGGSAAAVAAGVVPMAHAADGMGSIRIPAHYCGLFGLKPSRGRLPKGPSWAGLGDLSTSHVISRSVRDSAAMLDASACAEPGSSYWLQAPARPFLRELDAEPPKLRIGMTSTLPVGGGQPDAETLQALSTFAKIATDSGHIVTTVDLKIDGHPYAESLLAISASMLAYGVGRLAALTKRPADATTLEPTTLGCMHRGERLAATEVIAALDHVNVLSRRMARLFDGIDILVTPVCRSATLSPTPPARASDDEEAARETLLSHLDQIQFAPLLNLTGQPAMSVPIHWTADGTPVGVQCVAGFGNESLLFALAGQLERIRPWAGRRPPVWAGHAG